MKYYNGMVSLHCPIFYPADELLFGNMTRLDDDTPANKALQLHVNTSLN